MHKELEALAGIEVPTVKNFWDWIEQAFTPSYQEEVNDYLSQATDIVDLQQRMVYLSRRGMV